MLNLTVFNRTDYLHKNGFGKGWYAIKPPNQTKPVQLITQFQFSNQFSPK